MSILRKIIIKNWIAFFIGATLILLAILSLGNILSSLMSAKNGMHFILLKLLYDIPGYMVKILPVSCLISCFKQT
jgi:lipopolysaccharide export system permease protein